MKPEKKVILFLWIPTTFAILVFAIGDLLWAFGNPWLIDEYYASRFSGPAEANIWLLNELGFVGCILGCILLFCYFKLTLNLFKK